MLATVVASVPASAQTMQFVHPGAHVSQHQIDYTKAKIALGEEPWTSALADLQGRTVAGGATACGTYAAWSDLGWTPIPRAVVEQGPYAIPDNGGWQLMSDGRAAYAHALLWVYTGNTAHAAKAEEIINAWSYVLTGFGLDNAMLVCAGASSSFANAAELLKHTPGYDWGAADIAQAESMFRDVMYPTISPFRPGYNGNWDALMANGIMSMGVFLDDATIYNRGYDYVKSQGAWSTGTKGSIDAYINADGTTQESTRDPAHENFGILGLTYCAQIAYNQGDDTIYSHSNNRLLAGAEGVANRLLHPETNTYPTDPAAVNEREISWCWETLYAHYNGRLGLSTPNMDEWFATSPWGNPLCQPLTEELYGTFAAGGFGTLTSSAVPEETWKYRQSITIDAIKIGGTGPHTNFPVLVSLNGTDHADIFTYSRPDGHDIRFRDVDGATEYAFELVSYDATAQTAEFWIRYPSLSDANNVFYIYYGKSDAPDASNPSAVWSDYECVYHYSDDPSLGILTDSTGNNPGTTVTLAGFEFTSGDLVSGKVGTGWDYDDNQTVNSPNINVTGSWYSSVWFKDKYITNPPDNNNDAMLAGNPCWYYWDCRGGIQRMIVRYDCANVLGAAEVGGFVSGRSQNTNFNYLGITHLPGNTYEFFGAFYNGQRDNFINVVDGIEQTLGNMPAPGLDLDLAGVNFHPGPEPMGIGSVSYPGSLDETEGIVDELRIRESIPSDEWIETEYNNMNDPSTFMGFGGHESVSVIAGPTEPDLTQKATSSPVISAFLYDLAAPGTTGANSTLSQLDTLSTFVHTSVNVANGETNDILIGFGNEYSENYRYESLSDNTEGTTAETWFDTHYVDYGAASAEEFFLHYSEYTEFDNGVSFNAGDRAINYTSSAASGTFRFLPSFHTQTQIDARVDLYIELVNATSGTNGFSGMYFDNANFQSWNVTNTVVGGGIAEHPTNAHFNSQEFKDWHFLGVGNPNTDGMMGFMRSYYLALPTRAPGKKVIGNAGKFYPGAAQGFWKAYITNGPIAHGMGWEFMPIYKSGGAGNPGGDNRAWPNMTYNLINGLLNVGTSPKFAPQPWGTLRIATTAELYDSWSYLLVCIPDPTAVYVMPNQVTNSPMSPSGGDERWDPANPGDPWTFDKWLSQQNADIYHLDIGLPVNTEAPIILQNSDTPGIGPDPAGQSYTVYSREYEYGIVLIRTQWGSDTTSLSEVSVPLGGTYYLADENGIVDTNTPLTSVNIGNADGKILVKLSGNPVTPTPSISSASLVKPTNGETVSLVGTNFGTSGTVELGNASTYAASTIKVAQTTGTWNDSNIQFTTNIGSIPTSSVIYVYVTSGGVTSSGHQLSQGTPNISSIGNPAPINGSVFSLTGAGFGRNTGVAKVEIGDAATYGAVTKLQQQNINTWSNTSINITYTFGTITEVDDQYLYVTDVYGVVSSAYFVQEGALIVEEDWYAEVAASGFYNSNLVKERPSNGDLYYSYTSYDPLSTYPSHVSIKKIDQSGNTGFTSILVSQRNQVDQSLDEGSNLQVSDVDGTFIVWGTGAGGGYQANFAADGSLSSINYGSYPYLKAQNQVLDNLTGTVSLTDQSGNQYTVNNFTVSKYNSSQALLWTDDVVPTASGTKWPLTRPIAILESNSGGVYIFYHCVSTQNTADKIYVVRYNN